MTKLTPDAEVTGILPPRKHQAQPYGDLGVLNTKQLIADAAEADVLAAIMHDYLDLLESAVAIYESNGDYAAGIFSSGWCRFLDAASRRQCETDDNTEALSCGKWHCHESCWKTSKAAIETGEPVDMPCLGGIRVLALPIRAGGEIVGSISFGYGDPPKDPEKLQEIADRYGVSADELREQAEAYKPCSPEMLEIAKSRLQTSAKLIGTLVERKQAQQRTKASQLRYQKLFADAPAPIFLVDPKTKTIQEVNPAALALTGYSSGELRGSHFARILPETQAEASEILEAAEEEEEEEGLRIASKTIVTKSGEKRFVDAAFSYYVYADRPLIQMIAQDITERKQAEEALRESEELHRITLGNISDAVFITDEAGDFTYISPNAEIIFGYSHDEVQRLGNITGLLGPDFANPGGLIEDDDELSNLDCLILSKSGRPRSLLVNVKGVSIKGGSVLITCRDITERKQAEEATYAAQQELIRRQREEGHIVEVELEKVKAELVGATRMAAIGQMSAQIAHELRNPLGSVRNAAFYLAQLVNDPESGSADELQDFLGVIDSEVGTCNRIIRNLLEATSPKTAIKESVDLGQLVRAEFSRLDRPEDVRCRFESVPDPYVIQVDPVQWRQLVGNLLSNSLHAIGGSGEIEFRATRSDEFDEMTVRDSGPGMPEEHRPFIFDLLFTTKAKGTGLGLTICRQIVEGHGGTIGLAEQQDEGATFVIRLPRNPTC